jgi:hypothetical protein
LTHACGGKNAKHFCRRFRLSAHLGFVHPPCFFLAHPPFVNPRRFFLSDPPSVNPRRFFPQTRLFVNRAALISPSVIG